MNFELRDLRRAIVASEYGSLRQAAGALHIQQSSLSRSLKDLEFAFGQTLFQRGRSGTSVTAEGLEFLEFARRIVTEAEELGEHFQDRRRGENGRLTVGVHASLSAGNLLATLAEHRSRAPGVEIRLVDGSSDRLVAGIRNATIDVAFAIGEHCSWKGASIPIWSERVVAAVAQSHTLSVRDALRWDELRGETLLLPENGPGVEFHTLIESRLGCEEASRVRHHDVGLDRTLSLVRAGWGIALVLEGATGAKFPGVTFHEICDPDGPTRLHFRACWRDTNTNPALRAFLDLLRERYPDFSGAAGVG